ncbi:MAG: hydantoinase/oxoprolinase family protein [Alphaproteobacteria bacterium]
MLTVGIDVGGTFTDIVVVDRAAGRVATAKQPSRADDPSAAIVAGIAGMALGGRPIDRVVHGTTIATNALLERRGATTGLVTTAGCRDVIEIGRGRRLVEGGMFDIAFRRPEPLVPRDRRIEVRERIRADGTEEAALDDGDLVAAASALAGVEAVVVCFLHSYRFPEHERAAERRLRALLGPDVFITCSSTVNPQFREFERFSTAVANGYVGPKTVAYLGNLARNGGELSGARSTFVMGSAGGILDWETAALLPVRTILSGPAGGVVGARLAAEDAGFADVITCDMGGTSTDVALLKAGRTLFAGETIVSGVPIRASQIEINTIGAGAGSLIAIDGDGALAVGPGSAGAIPGPACYGNGGVEPTVTDANVVLGRIADGTLLGGRIRVQGCLARDAFAGLCQSGGYADAAAAAEGALEIVVAKSARAIREISLQRGFDPRDFVLVAFGGAGPMHATGIAEAIGIRTVLVPNHAGILSAVGLARAAIRRDAMAPYLLALHADGDEALREALGSLADGLRGQLARDGAPGDSIAVTWQVEARCIGQSHELIVDLGGDLAGIGAETIAARFRAVYLERYGRAPETAIELVQIRALAEAHVDTAPAEAWRAPPPERAGEPQRRTVRFDGVEMDAAILDRATMRPGERFAGPAIVEERGATTVVPPGWDGQVHPSGHLVLRAP